MPRQLKLQFGSGQSQQEHEITLQTDSLEALQQAAQAANPQAFAEVQRWMAYLLLQLSDNILRICNYAGRRLHQFLSKSHIRP